MLRTGVCIQVGADRFCGMKITRVSSRASDVGPSPDASDLFLKGGRECWNSSAAPKGGDTAAGREMGAAYINLCV